MQYFHFDCHYCTIPKLPGKPAGDVFVLWRNEQATLLALADGIGSGTRANIAANAALSRLRCLIESGFSLRESFAKLVKTMQKSIFTSSGKISDSPIEHYSGMFAALTLVRILNQGQATILSFEMPPPILLSGNQSDVITGRTVIFQDVSFMEYSVFLAAKESILIQSDGISQAGMGKHLPEGWGMNGVIDWCSKQILKKINENMVNALCRKAVKLNGRERGDDVTAIEIKCRPGKVLNIFTGPPANKDEDAGWADKFLNSNGLKIVCGATSAKMIAREIGETLEIDQQQDTILSPPQYFIEGINLVTEGSITLTQLYNTLDVPGDELAPDNPVTDLNCLISVADHIRIFAGRAQNPANKDIHFQQRGILKRETIIPLLSKKLNALDKLVTVNWM